MPKFDEVTHEKSAKLVRFSNGTLNNDDKRHLILKQYSCTGAAKTRVTQPNKHIVTAEINSRVYVGRDYGDTNRYPTEVCDYYLGVHNKKTGKVKVMPAQLIQLDPIVEDKQAADEVDMSQKNYRQKLDALTKEFGSGRSQRAVNKRERNQLDDEMVLKTTDSVVSNAKVEVENKPESEAPVSEVSSIPPYNKDATSPEQVYNMDDIIPPPVLSSLTYYSQVFVQSTRDDLSKWHSENKYFSIVLLFLEKLSLLENTRLLQSQYLVYLQCLMQTFLMKGNELRSKFPLPKDWPAPLKTHILTTFTLEINEPGRKFQRCVPSRMKDLLLSHIIVVALTLFKFNLSLDSLLKDLSISQRRLALHMRSLGCTVKKTKGLNESYVAVLTVPLKFPEIRAKADKKRIF
ncbi:DNA-directed RNA polymerase I subunit RPA49-like [Physella acuta]|uniref:DNA-directed RNA polymerase I subunit RPA49-like n=1 Tax=Physella acuta TaxID=109671 RepID=UPI0027DDA7F1|nr:DNA-directed RNA polymerase I subunit RPA49-like [Physella acuta]